MGALSDRYRIATEGAVDVQLAVQVLLNFDPKITGGDCSGGDALPAYKFIHRFGVSLSLAPCLALLFVAVLASLPV